MFALTFSILELILTAAIAAAETTCPWLRARADSGFFRFRALSAIGTAAP
jgi:hypothetical protein